jgi:hypothetical protein
MGFERLVAFLVKKGAYFFSPKMPNMASKMLS